MSVWRVLRLLAVLWLLTRAFRLLRALILAALVVALWPVTLTAAAAASAAWLRGWPPARLYRAAAWSALMTAVYLIAAALQARAWRAVALFPLWDWQQASRLLLHADIARVVWLIAPVAVPVGLAAGGAVWAWRTWSVMTGTSGRSAFAPAVFDARQWRRQVRAARGALSAPGAVPLVTTSGMVPVGAVIRVVGRSWTPVLAVPAALFARHMVIVGSSGSGKTNLMIRLWAGWYAAAQAAAGRGKPRPLLCALDCKGGPDARAKADRTRRVLRGVGARRVAVWPDEASLSLWDLPARELAVLLFQLTEHGTGAAAYYADMIQAILTMAVCAPGPPPASAAAFLDRLDPGWLDAAYACGRPGEQAALRAARPHIGDIQLRYATLLGRLGPALDGPGRLADADAWYFILEGTSEPSVAEAQAMAITELIAYAATSRHTEPRAMLLAADDYSAVSRRVPLSNLYERGRSLGLGVMVSAQSWQGLGRDEDERYRIAATADGGLWLMHTPYPEPLVQLAGTRRVLETAHKLIGATWGDEGTSRIQHAWTADPDLIRQLDTGQACYIHRGTATYLQVARPKPSPLSLPTATTPARPVLIPPTHAYPDRHQDDDRGPPTMPLPVVAGLEDVLGPGGSQ
ncbi:hypothetical protein [Trebonia sp.]|uniref:hypothetical protein n=1 Tax=Trebonia sp. TaxID=2767075 RepID=UPI00261DDA8B|nr:hypothetical protein [Trebonia sp.]